MERRDLRRLVGRGGAVRASRSQTPTRTRASMLLELAPRGALVPAAAAAALALGRSCSVMLSRFRPRRSELEGTRAVGELPHLDVAAGYTPRSAHSLPQQAMRPAEFSSDVGQPATVTPRCYAR